MKLTGGCATAIVLATLIARVSGAGAGIAKRTMAVVREPSAESLNILNEGLVFMELFLCFFSS